MAISLTIDGTKIITRVKTITYRKAKVDLSTKPNAEKLAFFEQAGSDTPDTTILEASLVTAVSNFLAVIAEFGPSYTEAGKTYTISVDLTSRFESNNTTTLETIANRYVENDILERWYRQFDAEQAGFYSNELKEDAARIISCFVKKQPSNPSHNYTDHINIDNFNSYVTPADKEFSTAIEGVVSGTNTLGIDNAIAVKEKKAIEVSRQPGSIDDLCIVCHSDNVNVSSEDGTFYVEGKKNGTAVVTIYSYHKPSVFKQIPFTVYA